MPTFNATDRVDTEKGIIHGVVLAQKGLNKNGTYFSDAFLSDMEKQGNAKGEVKSRFGHPNMCATSLGTYIGDYKNFRVGNGKLYGDLHLVDIAKSVNVPNGGISMYDYVLQMAEKHPEKFGNSIVVYADSRLEEITNEKGDKIEVESLVLVDFAFSDLVDEPAATDNLFHDTNDLGAKITEFLDENPKIFDVLDKNPNIFIDFIQRYQHYSSLKSNFNNKNMSILKKIRELAGVKESFDVDMTLDNGDIITVVTEAEEPQVGDPVRRKTDNGEESEGVLEDGEHTTQDGKVLVVADGVITEIRDKEENPEPTPEDINKAIEMAVAKVAKQFDEKIKTLSEGYLQLSKQFQTLSKSVKSNFKSEDPAPSGNNLEGNSKGISIEDIRERQKSYKS